MVGFLFLFAQVSMRALGFDVKKADVLKILKENDRQSTGKIVFSDFKDVSEYYFCPQWPLFLVLLYYSGTKSS